MIKDDRPPSLFSPLLPMTRYTGDYATIYSGDIRHPGKSRYGFPATAAQLAAHQRLLLHSREDEIFDLMAQLNDLLSSPTILDQAYELLRHLHQETQQKLSGLTLQGRLQNRPSLRRPALEIGGLKVMQTRLGALLPALARVKNTGFRVTVYDRQRQLTRPMWETYRQQQMGPVQPAHDLNLGFLLPAQHHLTLWTYLVGRNDRGQAVIWN